MWSNSIPRYPEKILRWFLIAWLVLNILQATFMGLHEDEAYYWMYSRYLDFGYFDHPPMIALFIKAGYSIFQNTLGVRLVTVITGTISIWVLWKTIKDYSTDIYLFAVLISSFLLLNIYGLMSTPDSPLFFFSVLFFYGYRHYVETDKMKWSVFIAIVCTCMLYSKYHAVLILLFTLAANPTVFKRRSFWLILSAIIFLFMPHILWQAKNGFPSIAFHLYDRSPNPYRISFTTEYLLGQLLITAPLAGWYFLYAGTKTVTKDIFIKTLKYNFYGIFLFFLLSTLKGRVEAHWTLTASVSLFMLCFIYLSKHKLKKWIKILILTNSLLLVLVRFLFIIPSPLKKYFPENFQFDDTEWIKKVKEIAGDHYVIFNKGFQEPAKYNFYSRSLKGFSYNSRFYRKNQFDLWDIDDSLSGKTVYYVTDYQHRDVSHEINFLQLGKVADQDSFYFHKKTFYGRWLDNVKTYQKVEVITDAGKYITKSGTVLNLSTTIYNPYKDTISFDNSGVNRKCFFEFGFILNGTIIYIRPVNATGIIIPPHTKVPFKISVTVPEAHGKYKLFFSLRVDPFPGTRNSRMIDINVE
jgi:hypothetical protein